MSYSNFQTSLRSELSFFPTLLFSKFSFPSSIFSPSLCLSHQYGVCASATVQEQQTKAEAERSNHCKFASFLGSFLNTKIGGLMFLESLLVT